MDLGVVFLFNHLNFFKGVVDSGFSYQCLALKEDLYSLNQHYSEGRRAIVSCCINKTLWHLTTEAKPVTFMLTFT